MCSGTLSFFALWNAPLSTWSTLRRSGFAGENRPVKQLVASTIDLGELQEKRLSGRRFHRTIEPKGFALPLPSAEWLDPQTRDQTSHDCLQAKPTCVLGKGAALRRRFDEGSRLFEQAQVVAKVGSKAARASGSVWRGTGRAALSFAPRRYRTRGCTVADAASTSKVADNPCCT